MHVHFHLNTATALGNLLLAKAILYPVSVVKSDSVQGRCATKHEGR